MSDAASDRVARDDAALLVPVLADDLLAAGADKDKVEHFMRLLKECNVQTHGALRLFHADLASLVHMMYDMQTPMGPLAARGFLASVRVRHPQTRPRPALCELC